MCLTGSGKTNEYCLSYRHTVQLVCPAVLSFRELAVATSTNMGDAGL